MMLVMVSVSGTAVASQSHVLGYLLIIKNFNLLQMRTEVDYAQTRLSIANVFNEFRQGRFVYLLASECLIERTFCCHKISTRSEEHTSELQSRPHLVCRLLLEKKKIK